MSDREPIRLYSSVNDEKQSLIEELPTSLSLGDPTMHETLRWHISVCAWCGGSEDNPPPQFGKPDTRKCGEYYEIVAEYSEYEATYIRMGNP